MRSSLALVSIATVVTACAAPGQRDATGSCPADEVCSPRTPQGLSFQGLRLSDVLFDGGLHATAAGGHQPVEVRWGDDGGAFGLPYEVDVTDPAFTATASGATVTLAAAAPADGLLRIVDSAGALYDRIAISAHAIDAVVLRPQTETVESGRGLALAAGATTTLVVALTAAGGGRLVDAGLTIAVSGAATVDARAWDAARLIAGTGGAAAIVATTGDGHRLDAALPIATTVDELALQARAPLRVGASETVCVSPLAAGRHVVGLAWTWSTTSDAGVGPLTGLRDNCAVVTARVPGPVALTVTAGGRTATMTLVATTGAAGRAAPVRRDDAGSGAGERAAAVMAATAD
ncbi:MAG: hypothetical protein JNK64_27240 [Myxococcales bacterium]|nr:hypothetical protein [Myxococcales bacterium]